MSARARGVAGLALLALASCRTEGYDNNDVEMSVRQRAKDMCSCVFVMKRDEAWCRTWTRVTPNVARAEVDHRAQRVTAVALGFYRSSARYHGRLGCTLEQ